MNSQSLTGATFVKGGVPDYDEGQGDDGQFIKPTCDRLAKAKLYKWALAAYKKARKKEPAKWCTGNVAEDKRLKGVYFRTFYPPDEILAQHVQGSPQAAAESCPASDDCADETGVKEAAPLFSDSACKIVSDVESVDKNAQEPLESEEGQVVDRRKLLLATEFKPQIPLDNSSPIEIDLSSLDEVAPDEALRRMRWVCKNVFDVLARKVPLRQVPFDDARWLCELALANPAQFETKYLEKLQTWWESKQAAIKADKDRVVDGNREVFTILKRVAKTGEAEVA